MADLNTENYIERSALYYPYIHIRNENWLKSAILAFQQVQRIVPDAFSVRDEEDIQPYSVLTGADGRPLLAAARSNTERVRQAQEYLFANLLEHEAAVIKRYSQLKTPQGLRHGKQAFQLHRMKIMDSSFSDWLVQNNLAWNTRDPDEQAFLWLTMHPRLGAAIMSVLALAVAKEEGLNVVTPSRRAHETLLANSERDVLAKTLGVPIVPDRELGEHVSVQELCQVVLITGFDLTRLKPEDIRDMVVEGGRELRNFYRKLSTFAGNIPGELGEDARHRLLNAKAEEVLEDWRSCTRKLPRLKEAIKEAAVEKGLEKIFNVAKAALILRQPHMHFLDGIDSIILTVLLKTGSTMLRSHDTPYGFLNRVEKVVRRSIGSLYVPQWRKLAS